MIKASHLIGFFALVASSGSNAGASDYVLPWCESLLDSKQASSSHSWTELTSSLKKNESPAAGRSEVLFPMGESVSSTERTGFPSAYIRRWNFGNLSDTWKRMSPNQALDPTDLVSRYKRLGIVLKEHEVRRIADPYSLVDLDAAQIKGLETLKKELGKTNVERLLGRIDPVTPVTQEKLAKLEHLTGLVQSPSLRRRDREMGNGGTHTPPPTPFLPPSKNPLVIGEVKGKKCVSEVVGTAGLVSPRDDKGRSLAAFERFGFNEVGRLSVSSPRFKTLNCSFVLLSRNWAITAHHCVALSVDGQARLVTDPSAQLGAKVDLQARRCRWGSDRLDCSVVPIELVKIHRPGKAWKDPKTVPEHDLALLEIRVPPEPGFSFAVLDLEGTAPSLITTAGWGVAEQDFEPGSRYLVGWRKGGTPSSNGIYTWQWTADPLESLPCGGDSGGPAYAGRTLGRIGDRPHRVFGILSYLEYEGERSDEVTLDVCARGKVKYVYLPAYKQFICSHASTLSGCLYPYIPNEALFHPQALVR